MTKNLPATDALHAPLAGFEKRLYAIAVDMIILLFVAAVLQIYQYALLVVLLQAVYFSCCWTYVHGQTLGNKLLHIRVISLSGKRLSLVQSLIRYFGFFLSEIVVFLGFAWILWDKKRQGWHDKLAKTIVISV